MRTDQSSFGSVFLSRNCHLVLFSEPRILPGSIPYFPPLSPCCRLTEHHTATQFRATEGWSEAEASAMATHPSAAITYLSFFPAYSNQSFLSRGSSTLSFRSPFPLTSRRSLTSVDPLQRRKNQSCFAFDGDLLGDFGARDPFPAEIESNFGEKVLGNVSTEHKILIPNITVLSLAQQDCTPVSASQPPMSDDDARKLLMKVVGWRLVQGEGDLRLQCRWKLRDFSCGIELINRIARAVQAGGHYPNLHLEYPNQVRAELWTASIGGLSMNDFIVAAKIDEIKTSDLVPRKRIWA